MASGSVVTGASGPGSRKRKASPGPSSGRRDRYQQLHVARQIPTQPVHAALKDGELDLQAFVAAHEFEIRSLEESMATSKAVASSRAFQKVPRGLRRRTASHNPKRVPKRLRPKAIEEMKEDNTPVVEARKRKPRTTRARIRAETARRLGILATRKRKQQAKNKSADGQKAAEKPAAVVGRKPRPKIRRNELNEPPTPPAKFRKRQLNKIWLPTHLWHAKRARMTQPNNPLWRFVVPLTPNEKIYRPMHRTQGDRGVAVWDVSYVSTIGLYGNAAGMQRVLRRVGVSQDGCWNERGKTWRLGTRSWSGLLSRETKQGPRPIGTATIVWNPASQDEIAKEDPEKRNCQVLIRVPPSAFLELFKELLRLAKMETPQLYIEDLRYEIGSIDLTGPASTEALASVLTPYPMKPKPQPKHVTLFKSITGLSNPSALPRNSVLAFSIQDPRLKHPPKRPDQGIAAETDMDLLQLLADWPAEEGLKPYDIFDRDARHQASLLPSQKHINRRRSAIPNGTTLKPASMDPKIPILLLATRSGQGTQTQGTWTLLAPWKCILPIWYSLVHCPLSSGCNPRFAGLNESRQIAFERGLPWFPADYLHTNAGVEWELEQRRARRLDWGRRPKSKRVEWNSLDLGACRKGEVGDGLACDFELLFASSKPQASTETQLDDGMDFDMTEAGTLRQLSQMTKTAFSKLVSTLDMPPPIPSYAILTVNIRLLARGVVGPCARIYRLPTRSITTAPSSSIEVPATHPPPASNQSSTSDVSLPNNLRDQWLSQLPSPTSAPQPKGVKLSKATDIETRKLLLAKELLEPPRKHSSNKSRLTDRHGRPIAPGAEDDVGFVPKPTMKPNMIDIGGHPLVPNAEDLIGFVTSGSFNLAEGCGTAIGTIAVDKVLSDVKVNAKEGKLCIVRNSGENVGWIARWEVVPS
jgi:ribonuclease P/MRP protein subunit POP1